MLSFSTVVKQRTVILALGLAGVLGVVGLPAGAAHADPGHPPRGTGPNPTGGAAVVVGQPGASAARPFLNSSPAGPTHAGVIMANTEGDFHAR